ncbi:hypothetical protein 1 [Hubei picorna-like virus 6]|uniref:hypothetical protein 1 n=1 Tax=Hubei picorna-like virus 6 TaxID=1923142 RepID=UPI00090BBA60|nr:hypothetical protein 1 [Hubei picorna-like virus 6]APG78394.1 hypothetical protein 1 [Hubei picorna-like virus 6]
MYGGCIIIKGKMEQTQPITGTGRNLPTCSPQTFLLASSCYSNFPRTCLTELLLKGGVSLEAVIAFCACDTWWLEPDGALVTTPTSRSGWTIHAARKFLTLYEVPSIIVYNDGRVNYLINIGLNSQEMFQNILLGQKAFFLCDGHWSIGGYSLEECRPLLDVHLLEGGFGKKKPVRELPNYGWEESNPKDDRALYVQKQTEHKRKEYLNSLPKKPRKISIPKEQDFKYYAAASDALGIATDVASLILIVKAYVRTKDSYVMAVGLVQMFSFVRENVEYMQLLMQNLPGLDDFSVDGLLQWLKERCGDRAEVDNGHQNDNLVESTWSSLLASHSRNRFYAVSMLDVLSQFNASGAGKLLGKFFSASVLTLMAKSIKSHLDITVAQQLIMGMARDCDFVDLILSVAKKGVDFLAKLFPLKFQVHIRRVEDELEFSILRKKVESSMDVSPIVVYQKAFYPYREGGLPELIADFERYRELGDRLGKPLVRHFESKFSDFNFFSQGASSRPLPFGVALVGPPGVGKTTMIEDIWTISREVWNVPRGESVAISVDAKFDDPYCGNDFVLLDDIGVTKPERTTEDPFARIIRIMQTTKNFSEQAEAHNKGKVPWNVKTLCVTSNLDRLSTFNYVNNPIAILRRFHIYLEVLPKDPTKYTFDFINVSSDYFEDSFNYVFKTVNPEFNSNQPLVNPTNNSMRTVAEFGSRSQALQYLTERMREHVKLQEKERNSSGPLCLECFKRPCWCKPVGEEKENVVDMKDETKGQEEEKIDWLADYESLALDPFFRDPFSLGLYRPEGYIPIGGSQYGESVQRHRTNSAPSLGKFVAVTRVIKSKTNLIPFIGLFGLLTILFYWRAIWFLACAVGSIFLYWNCFPLFAMCVGFAFMLCCSDIFGYNEQLQSSAFTILVTRGVVSFVEMLHQLYFEWYASIELSFFARSRKSAVKWIFFMVICGITSNFRIAYYKLRLYGLNKWCALWHKRSVINHNSKLSLLLATIAGVTVIGAIVGHNAIRNKKKKVEVTEKEQLPQWGLFSSCTKNTGVAAHGLKRSEKRTVCVQFNGRANMGYFIDSNRVLTVAHLFSDAEPDQEVKVMLHKNGEIAYEKAVPFSSVEVFKDKDFAIITVPDHQTRYSSLFQHSCAATMPLSVSETYYYNSPLKGTGVVKFLCTSNNLSYVDTSENKISPPVLHVFYTSSMENKMEYGDCGTMIVDSQGLNVGIVVAASHGCPNFLVIPYPSLSMQVVEQPVVEPQVQGTVSESVVFDAVTARPFGASVKIGEVRGVVVKTSKSDAKKSLLAGMQLNVNGEVPDPEKFGPPSIFRPGKSVRTGVYDTYHRNLGILKQAKANVDKTVLSKAIEDYWDRIRGSLTDDDLTHIHPESYFNALSGKEHGVATRIVRSAKLNTAVGYPFASGKKRDHIQLLEDEVVFSSEFGSFLEKFENMLLEGETPFTFCKASPKDEVTKISKTKTRLFYVGDSATYCVIRKYFWWFPMLVYKHPLAFECAFGINPYSQEWTDIQTYLNEFEYHQAADFSDWDLRLPQEFMEGAFTILERLADLGDGFPSSKFFSALKPLFTSPIALFGTELYNLEQGTVSGHPLTYLFNSIANSLRARYCFYTLFPEGKRFSDHVRAIYGGADAHETTNLYPFNQLTTLPIMMGLGIRPTDSNKNIISEPFSPKEEVTFLKRDEQGRLDIQSIHKMLMWTTSTSALEHASGSIVSALYEMHLYGKEAFDNFVESLRQELPRAAEFNPSNGFDLSYILQEKAAFLDFDADCYKFNSTLENRIPEIHFDKKSLEFLQED